MTIVNKSPLGLMPERIWNEKNPYPKPSNIASRVEALEAALWRYYEAGCDTGNTGNTGAHFTWLNELAMRRDQLRSWQ